MLAEDGCEALAYAQNEAVDLVLTDINMPNLDGFDLIKGVYPGFAKESKQILEYGVSH